MGPRDRGEAPAPGAWRQARLVLPLLTIVALLVVPSSASASFHLIKVREVYPAGDASYVELQTYEAGEYLVAGHHLVTYNANGSVASDFVLPNNVSAASPDNSTVLIADSGYAGAFPSGPAPDESSTGLNLSALGGAVCWTDGSPPDCVAWGNFTGPLPAHAPPLVVGAPASPGGVTAGKALRRSIAPGCSTFLELGDDSDSSAADFSEQTPNPRANASPISETACALPTVIIDTKPKTPTNASSAQFTFHSSPPGASFECKRDGGLFEACASSGVEYTGLADANHNFQVRATDVNGTGPAASYSWTVDTKPPTASIKNHPADRASGVSASFTYQSDEINSKFECSLASSGGGSFESCPASGKVYTALADGTYTFKVRATDQAGNQQATPAEFSWEVDNSLADTTPPETTIESRPTDPSGTSTASFTYASNEPSSSFECNLDGAGFTGCPATGISYSGLGNGPHSFQVRATDVSANTDPTPAGYSFEVVLSSSALPALPVPQPSAETPRPNTTITAKPAARTGDHSPTFRFRSTAAGATFQCKVDNGPFKPCRSPFTTKTLSLGRHTLKVRAMLGGVRDTTPAAFAFTVVNTR